MSGNIYIACGSLSNNIHQPEDGLVVYSSHQIWTHSLGALAWMDSTPVCLLCPRLVRPCLYTHKTYGMLGNPSMECGFSSNNILNPEDDFEVLQFSSKLVPQLGCSEAWMDNTPVYALCPRLVRPCIYTHKTCGMLGNPSMACGSSPNNILNPEDGFVVLQFSPNLVPPLGCSEVLMNSILVY
jgi:hypothetical protein